MKVHMWYVNVVAKITPDCDSSSNSFLTTRLRPSLDLWTSRPKRSLQLPSTTNQIRPGKYYKIILHLRYIIYYSLPSDTYGTISPVYFLLDLVGLTGPSWSTRPSLESSFTWTQTKGWTKLMPGQRRKRYTGFSRRKKGMQVKRQSRNLDSLTG